MTPGQAVLGILAIVGAVSLAEHLDTRRNPEFFTDKYGGIHPIRHGDGTHKDDGERYSYLEAKEGKGDLVRRRRLKGASREKLTASLDKVRAKRRAIESERGRLLKQADDVRSRVEVSRRAAVEKFNKTHKPTSRLFRSEPLPQEAERRKWTLEEQSLRAKESRLLKSESALSATEGQIRERLDKVKR